MTGKELSLRALNLKKTDRLPVVGGRIRQIDFLTEVVGISRDELWKNPEKISFVVARKLGADAVFGPTYPIKESEIGAACNIDNKARFSKPEDILDYISDLKPLSEEIAAIDYQKTYKSIKNKYLWGYKNAGDMLFIPFGIGRTADYQGFYDLFGMENFMMAMVLYQEKMMNLFKRSAEIRKAYNKIVADVIKKENLPRYMWFGHDICDNKGPMVAPEVLERIYFPFARKAVEPLRKAGIRIIWHSDGNIMPIADSLINILGVDGFQGFQTEVGVDIEKLSKMITLRGEKTILVGGINNITLVNGNKEDVIKEIEYMISIAEKRGGGVLLSVSSSSGPEVKKENLYTIFEYYSK